MKVLLVAIVVLLKFSRAQPSYVPCMKELMGDQPEPFRVLGALSLRPAAGHQDATVIMLEPSACLGR